MKVYFRHKVTLIVCFYCLFASAQTLPSGITPKTLTVTTPRAVGLPNPTPQKTYTPAVHLINPSRQQQQLAEYEKDRLRVAQYEKDLQDIYRDIEKRKNINYNLPETRDDKARFYHRAFDSLNAMNPNNFSIKEATFIIENAFYENQRDYSDFDRYIKGSRDFIKKAMQEQKLDPNNNLAKNLTIYQFITDTLTVQGKKHLPYSYDFNDYMGKENWDNMFVQKLMYEGKGQCNSLPRYYLILAEELKADANLAFAPNHSFIKFQDYKGDWYNAELTSGALMADALMLSSGFIKSETVVNGNYVTPQNNKQVMSQLLNDLALGYISKFGRDEFVEDIINKSLELNPSGINANIIKFNYELDRFSYVAQQLKVQSPKDLQPFPKALKLFNDLAEQDRKLKALGFEEMPQDRYNAWLKSLEEEKKKQDGQNLLNGIKKTTIFKD